MEKNRLYIKDNSATSCDLCGVGISPGDRFLRFISQAGRISRLCLKCTKRIGDME